MNQKDLILKSLKITDTKDVSVIYGKNKDQEEEYIFSGLTCQSGAAIHKGISIGFQDKMVPGLMIYDDENFYGYSEKYGLTLLSNHHEYQYLEIPDDIYMTDSDKSINRLQPTPQNTSEHFKNLSDTDKVDKKNINVDIEVRDVSNFYITIPNEYSNNNMIITFDITYIYNLDTIISNLSLVIINESTKSVYFRIINTNCYYESGFENEITKKSIHKINLEIINPNYFLITKKHFTHS